MLIWQCSIQKCVFCVKYYYNVLPMEIFFEKRFTLMDSMRICDVYFVYKVNGVHVSWSSDVIFYALHEIQCRLHIGYRINKSLIPVTSFQEFYDYFLSFDAKCLTVMKIDKNQNIACIFFLIQKLCEIGNDSLERRNQILRKFLWRLWSEQEQKPHSNKCTS